MECGLLLDVVVRQCSSLLKMLPLEGQPLLVRRNSFLVLDICHDIVNGIGCLDVQGEGLASVSFHKDQHGKDLLELNGLGR